MIADVSAPWPAFSFVGRDYNNNNNININTSSIASNQEVSNDIISKQNSIRECLFPALAEGISIFVNQAKKVDVDIEVDVEVESKGNDEDLLSVTVERICREFHSTPSQAQSWLDRTIYGAPTMAVDEGIFTTAIATLQEVQLVPTPYVNQTYAPLLSPPRSSVWLNGPIAITEAVRALIAIRSYSISPPSSFTRQVFLAHSGLSGLFLSSV
eukprot:gene7210-14702_t